jgi:L-lactate dehydrogenase (cytochrome)
VREELAVADRRLPKWGELAPLLSPRGLHLSPTSRRLAYAASITDLREAARKRVPQAVFDYTDGAAGDELSLARMRAAYRSIEFRPGVLRDVSSVDPSTTLLGTRSALPLIFAPTGFTRMMHTEGEPAVGRVAGRAGIPYALSTLGTTSIERLAEHAPGTRLWFQLYLWKDRVASQDFVTRAAESGYEALVLTVDTPVAGPRLRDVRNGMTLPPSLTLRTFLDGATHPAWWLDFLTTQPLEFASLTRFDGTVAELAARMFDPSATFADLEWLRGIWKGPVLVKGIQTESDAKAVVDAGADAVIVSNHGGRQLDRSPVPLIELPRILDAVGDRAEVYVDGGVLNGGDVVAAVALGARGVLVGRAYLYGLMAGGEQGVQKAFDILNAEIRSTMALLGVSAIAELRSDHIRPAKRPTASPSD